MTQSSSLLLTAGTLLLVSQWSLVVIAQINEVPPCFNEVAAACAQNALKSVEPSACNWHLIVPILSQCVNEATSGCSTRQIIDWLRIVTQFNETLNSPDCSPTCQHPDRSKTQMDNCYHFVYTVNGKRYTTLDAIVNDIFQSPRTSNPVCPLLGQVVGCLTNATMGCTALMDVTERRLASLSVNNASAVCNVRMFAGPTTSAPLAIFDAITIPTTTTTTEDHFAVIIGAGSGNELTAAWISLIVIGAVVCVAIVVAVGVLLHRSATYRKQAKQLDQLQRKQEISDQNQSAVREVLSRHNGRTADTARTRVYRLP